MILVGYQKWNFNTKIILILFLVYQKKRYWQVLRPRLLCGEVRLLCKDFWLWLDPGFGSESSVLNTYVPGLLHRLVGKNDGWLALVDHFQAHATAELQRVWQDQLCAQDQWLLAAILTGRSLQVWLQKTGLTFQLIQSSYIITYRLQSVVINLRMLLSLTESSCSI